MEGLHLFIKRLTRVKLSVYIPACFVIIIVLASLGSFKVTVGYREVRIIQVYCAERYYSTQWKAAISRPLHRAVMKVCEGKQVEHE